MPSLDQNIRGALQNALDAISGLPTVVYEGKEHTPIIGTPFLTVAMVYGAQRPADMGPSHAVLHEGTLEINIVWPTQRVGAVGGTGPAESLANTVKQAYHASNIYQLNGVFVRTRYAERVGAVMADSDWIRLSLRVAWYVYDTQY